MQGPAGAHRAVQASAGARMHGLPHQGQRTDCLQTAHGRTLPPVQAVPPVWLREELNSFLRRLNKAGNRPRNFNAAFNLGLVQLREKQLLRVLCRHNTALLKAGGGKSFQLIRPSESIYLFLSEGALHRA